MHFTAAFAKPQGDVTGQRVLNCATAGQPQNTGLVSLPTRYISEAALQPTSCLCNNNFTVTVTGIVFTPLHNSKGTKPAPQVKGVSQ